MKRLRSFVFNSPLKIENIFAVLANMDTDVQWSRGDSEYCGSHIDGTTKDGNDVRFFEGKWEGRPEGFVVELLSSAEDASQEALLAKTKVALDVKDWRETAD